MPSLDEALSDGRGVERPFNCPAHDDTNASASVNVDKGLWYCYACGAHGAADGTVPKPDAVLRALAGITKPRVMRESWLDVFDASGPSPYWSSRVGIDVARHFRCGTDISTGLPTYPIRDLNGGVIGVVLRNVGDLQPKYLYPSGVPVSQCLFTAGKGRKVLLLVEGAGDVMALHRDGIPRTMTVAGVYGSGLHAAQADAINERGYALALLGFDADSAGDAGAKRAEGSLRVPCVRVSWGRHKDAGAHPPGEAMSVVHGVMKAHEEGK